MHPHGFEAGDALLHAVGERRLRRLGPEAVDERLHAGDLLGLEGGLLGEATFVLGPRRAVLAVRALVLGDVADGVLGRAVEVQHAGDGLVEQFEVVADDQQRSAVLPEEAHQPLLGIDVEVVRRLVEAQHVAAGEQDPRQLDPPALAARQHTDREVDAVLVDPQPGRHRARFALGRVSAAHAEHLLGARIPVDVALVRSLLHLDAELLDPFQLLVDAAAGQHVGHGGAAVENASDAGILRQVAEPALADHPPGGRVDGAAQNTEQARLAGAVAADDADLVAGHDGEAAPTRRRVGRRPPPRAPAPVAPDQATVATVTASTSSAAAARGTLAVSIAGPIAVGCCAMGAVAYIAALDPSSGGASPLCPLRSLTGWWCPGCGLTRAAHHLLHGDIGRAHGYNALVVPVVVLLTLAWIAWLLDARGRRPAWLQRVVIPAFIGFGIVAAVFAVARNLPSFDALRG